MPVSRCHVACVLAAIGAVTVTRAVLRVTPGIMTRVSRVVLGPSRVRAIAAGKQADVSRQIDEAKTWLAAQPTVTAALQREVLAASAASLVAMQRDGKVTAVQLLAIFVAKAVASQATTNCITWMDIARGAAAAGAADEARAAGAALGPLHGLPISIKDCVMVEGTDATLGMSTFVNKPAGESAASVKLVERAGGILFCKTNLPQTMVAFESINYIFGKCSNPYSKLHAAGGSSGGEGAIVADFGSAIGIGTDIGGSIRVPAHFCGVCGFKPTQWRVPAMGNRAALPGQEAVPSVVGPLARSVDDLVTMMQVLLNGNTTVDGNTSAVPFRDDLYAAAKGKTRITFGYYVDDQFAPASPPCERAVRASVAALEAAGHRCVEVKADHLGLDAVLLMYRLMTADGGFTLKALLGSEPVIPHIDNILRTAALPQPVRLLAAWYFRVVKGDPAIAAILLSTREKSVTEYWRLHAQRQQLRDVISTKMRQEGIDCFLCPGLATPAMPHGVSKDAMFGCMMTALLNLGDCPAAMVPVLKVDKAIDRVWDGPVARYPVIETRIRAMYDPVREHGLPVGVQLYSTKSKDEEVLGYANVLEAALRLRPAA